MTHGTNDRVAIRWQIVTYAVALVLCILQLRWQALDQVPPAWDQAGYLVRAVRLFEAGQTAGWRGFIYQIFFDSDRGRVGFITILVQPFFALFGVSLRVAMMPYALLWFLAAWAMSGIAREAGRQFFDMATPQAAAAGTIAFLLFAANPTTMWMAQNYLVEFPLVIFAAATLYAVLAYRAEPRTAWLIVAGVAVGLGMLTKVTFPAFLIPTVLIHGRTLLDMKGSAALRQAAIVPVLVAAIVCGPIYVVNFRPLVGGILLLSSARLGEALGLPSALDLQALANFAGHLFRSYENLLTVFAAVGFGVVALRSPPASRPARFVLLVFAIGFLIPFVIAGLGAIKDSRYSYPAWINLFVLAGLLLATLARTPLRRAVLAALFIVPVIELAVANGIDPGGLYGRIALMPRPPDSRDHHVDALVAVIADTLHADKTTPAHIVMLAGSTEFCHSALLTYTAMRQGNVLAFDLVPAFSKAGMTADEALGFIRATPHDAILYKTGETVPPSFMALDADVVRALDADTTYRRVTLPFAEPEGCAFDLFIKERSGAAGSDQGAPAAAGP